MTDDDLERIDAERLDGPLWPFQADVAQRLVKAAHRSRLAAEVVCTLCGSLLCELLELRDERGEDLPALLVVYLPIPPGHVIWDGRTGEPLEVVTGQTSMRSRAGRSGRKLSDRMLAQLYGVMVAGVEDLAFQVECGHHGDRGKLTPRRIYGAARSGKPIRL